MLAHNWADPRATQRSYELIARHVMPHFPGPRASRPWMPPARAACRAAPSSPRNSRKRSKVATEAYAKDKASRVG